MVMIKDNHISVAGGIANAMRSVDQFLQKEKLTIPVEVGTFVLMHMLKRTNLCVYVFCGSPLFRLIWFLDVLFNYVHIFPEKERKSQILTYLFLIN